MEYGPRFRIWTRKPYGIPRKVKESLMLPCAPEATELIIQDMTDQRRNDELRERIRVLLAQGKTQAEIARKLKIVPATVAYHKRGLGIAAKKYATPGASRDGGKRRCAECTELRTPGQFPSPRNAVCRRCIKARKRITPYSEMSTQ